MQIFYQHIFPIFAVKEFFNLKRVIVSVTNDLSSDQRVDRVCRTLHEMGFDVLLIGRAQSHSLALQSRIYKTKRFKFLINKGPLFYASYNIRLFSYLLFHSFDILVANDLDTLLANYLANKTKRKKLVYDTHEFFTGVPELEKNNFARKTWTAIEKWIFPKLNYIFTVNNSIASLYNKLYDKKLIVVRNVPFNHEIKKYRNRKDLELPEDKKIILYQGSINKDRGLEEAVIAMKNISNAVLLIIGDGDITGQLRELVLNEKLENKVQFINKINFENLQQYTLLADVGLSIEKDTNLNYKYCLPNKLFDYIQAHVPVLVSPLIEMVNIVEKYQIGEILENHSPENIAKKINEMLFDSEKLICWKTNSEKAAKELCWENEKTTLIEIYKELL